MKGYLGLDVGSVSMKGVIINDEKEIVKSYYVKNSGLVETVKDVLTNLKIEIDITGVGITGSGRNFISTLIGGDIIESEVISHFIATTTIYPDVQTIIDIGGEDCKLMVVSNGDLTSFNMNRDCGGGTGAMIESLASRMNIKLEDIGDIALKSTSHVAIASKCGIFAQSAVVSKLNKGISKENILMGVCRGLVGNYFTMLAKGINLKPPYVFQGATAKNKALVKCMEDELGDGIIVPEHPELMGAYGVALLVKEEFNGCGKKNTNFKGFENVNADFETKTYNGDGCPNSCEITNIYRNGKLIAHIGNRCGKCVRN